MSTSFSGTEPFGNAEAELSLEPVEREGRRFARMCYTYGGLNGSVVNFNSTDFKPEALAFGIKVLTDRGYDVAIGPAKRTRTHQPTQDSVARISKRTAASTTV
jgi:hypothetical protein